MDSRDVKLLDYNVDGLIDKIDEGTIKYRDDYNGFFGYIEESVDQVLQALDANQWTSLTQHGMNQVTPDLPQGERIKLIRLARLYYLKDPLIHQATSLITNYTIADGFRYYCNDNTWQSELDDWWHDEDNLLELTSQQAQEQKSIDLIVDGEIFFVLFRDAEGRVKVRTLPPEEITEVISHPEDYRRNLYYQRKFVPQTFNFKSGMYDMMGNQQEQTTYFADWHNYNPGKWGFEQGMRGLQEGVVYQIATNRLARQKRGNTETYPALDWVKAHREMLQNWVTIVKAYATLAWKAKAKGGDDRDLSRIRDKLQAFLPAFNPQTGQLSQPSGVAGVQIENDNLALTPMKTAGMATDPADSRQVRLMAGAGLGIMEHYFGDAGNANLATAQAMELPMLKKFAARQRYWEDVYRAIAVYVIMAGIDAGRISGKVDDNLSNGLIMSRRLVPTKEQVIVIQAPPILQRNLAEVGQGLVPLEQNSLILKEDAARYAMKALDIENVEQSLEELKVQWKEEEAKAEALLKQIPDPNQPPVADPNKDPKQVGRPTANNEPKTPPPPPTPGNQAGK